jgi:hypothetical protein
MVRDKPQGQHSHGSAYYRCRFPQDALESRVSPSAMRNRPLPARNSAKMRRTTGAAVSSGVNACNRLPSAALAGFGVRTDVFEGVAVGWPAAEVAAFQVRLGGHRGAYPDLHAVAFATSS